MAGMTHYELGKFERKRKRQLGFIGWLRHHFGTRMFTLAEVAYMLDFAPVSMTSVSFRVPLDQHAEVVQEAKNMLFTIRRLKE